MPKTIFIRRDTRRLARRRKPRGSFPRRSFAFLIENLYAACPPLAPCGARFPHSGSPAPAAKHTYIDAFNGKTVTRETLLRYTFKSLPVNVLIRGFLWKNSHPDSVSISDSEGDVIDVTPVRGAEARNLSPRSYFSLDFCYDERILVVR